MGEIIDFSKRKEMKELQNNMNLDAALDDAAKELDKYMFSYLEDHNMYDTINDILENDEFHEDLLTHSIGVAIVGKYSSMADRETFKRLLSLSIAMEDAMADERPSPEIEDFLINLRLHAYDLVNIKGYLGED